MQYGDTGKNRTILQWHSSDKAKDEIRRAHMDIIRDIGEYQATNTNMIRGIDEIQTAHTHIEH